MPKVNKKLLTTLIISILLLISLLAYRSTYTKKPLWDAAFDTSSAAVEFKQSAESVQACTPEEGTDKCDQQRRTMLDKFTDASFYNYGFEYCLNKFGKTAEQCKSLVNKINTDKDLNHIAPSRRE